MNVHARLAHDVFERGRIHVAGTGAHDEPFEGGDAHGGVDGFSVADGGHGTTVAEMEADETRLVQRLADKFSGRLGDELVGGAVEAVAAQAVFRIPLGGNRIEIGLRRHGLVEGRVEDGHLRGGGKKFLRHLDAHQVGGIVQRAQREELADGFLDGRRHPNRFLVDFSAQHHAMSHALDFGGLADDAFLGVGQQRDHACHALAVRGQRPFLDELFLLSAGEGLVDHASDGFADFFDESRGEQGEVVDILDVHELILDGGTAGIDDEDFHDGGFIAFGSGQNKRAGF